MNLMDVKRWVVFSSFYLIFGKEKMNLHTDITCSDNIWSYSSLGLSNKIKIKSNLESIACDILRFSLTVLDLLEYKNIERII